MHADANTYLEMGIRMLISKTIPTSCSVLVLLPVSTFLQPLQHWYGMVTITKITTRLLPAGPSLYCTIDGVLSVLAALVLCT